MENSLKKLIMLLGVLIVTLYGVAVSANAEKKALESLYVVDKAVITETVYPDGKVVQIDEMTTLVKSQYVVDAQSQADIPYNSTLSNLEVVEAYTITPRGEKIPVAANAIRTVEDDNSAGAVMFSDQKHKIIIFPKVTPGARTYYKTKLTTYTPLMPGYFYSNLGFSPRIEVKSYEYHLSYPANLKLYQDTRGVQQVRNEISNGMRHLSFAYQNKAIKKKEPYEVSYGDYAPYIHLSTFPSQSAFAKSYELLIEPKIKVTPQVKKLADEITQGIKRGAVNTPELQEQYQKAQARAIYNWVARNIRYVAIYLGDGGIVPHHVDSIINNRYGDCKDHNALLIALLAAKGIDATSALINSGSAYTVPKYPIIDPFNHVITYIPAWDLYLDSTAEMAPFGVLPLDQLDKPTLLTKLASLGRTPKPTLEDNQSTTAISMEILPSGQIKGKAHTKYFGSADMNARYRYEGAETSLSEGLVKSQLAKFQQTGEGTITTSPVYDLNQAFTSDTEFTIDAASNFPGPGAMTIPVGLAPGELATIATQKPPEKFTVPYVCVTRWIGEIYQIKFPKETKITRIPKDVMYQQNGIQYKAKYVQLDNDLFVSRSLEVQRPAAVCQPEELQHWKDFYKVFIKDMRGQIFYE